MNTNELKYAYIDDLYKSVAFLGDEDSNLNHKVFLAQNMSNKKIVIKKEVDNTVIPVYEKLKGIQNPHLATIYDCISGPYNGLVIEEYISGITLQEYICQKGTLSEQETRSILSDLCSALSEIHKSGIVHRDITPDNILISNDGVLKLIDFGIARENKEAQYRDTTILGTAGYAAPEQFGFFQTDARSDIYSLGVLMNVLLTGKFPNECLYSGPKLKKIIQKCTKIDADYRFQNVEEVKYALLGRRNHVILGIPGFRTGTTWKSIVALLGYFLMGIYSIASLSECASTPFTFILEFIALCMYMWGNTLLAFDIFYWTKCIYPFNTFHPKVNMVFKILMWISLFYIGVLLENHVRYDILGLVRPSS